MVNLTMLAFYFFSLLKQNQWRACKTVVKLIVSQESQHGLLKTSKINFDCQLRIRKLQLSKYKTNCYQFVIADGEDSQVDQVLDVRREVLEVVVAEKKNNIEKKSSTRLKRDQNVHKMNTSWKANQICQSKAKNLKMFII